MWRKSLSAVLVLATAAAPANAQGFDATLEGLDQIAAIIRASLPPECPIQPFVNPPALIIGGAEIDEPPEGDLGIEVRLALSDGCAAIAENALRAARLDLVAHGLRAIGFLRRSNVITIYYGQGGYAR